MRTIINFLFYIAILTTSNVYAENYKYELKHAGQGYESAKIISQRLNSAKSIFDSEVTVIEDSGTIYLIIDEDIVNSDYFNYLTSQLGKLEAFTESGADKDIWFTEADIKNTGTTKNSVDIEVDDIAATKIKDMSTKHQGKILTILLDGQLLLRARVNQPIGKFFRIKSSSIENPEYSSIILKYGSINKNIKIQK